MKHPKIITLVIFLFAFINGLNAQNHENGFERFYNVKSYNADISIIFEYKEDRSEAEYTKSVKVTQRFQYNFTTTPGTMTFVDMFQNERGEKAEPGTGKNDLFNNVNLDSIANTLNNSQIDPNIINQIKESNKKMQDLNMSSDKYKNWMVTFDGKVSSSVYSKYSKDESGSIHCGEGQGMGHFENHKNYSGSISTELGRPDLNNPGSFILQLNLVNNTYSFSVSPEIPREQEFVGSEFKSDCGRSSTDDLKMNAHTFFRIMKIKEGVIYKEPLSGTGMVLSGSRIITDICTLKSNLKDDAKWSVRIVWKIYPSDMEIPEVSIEFKDDEGQQWLPEDKNSIKAKISYEEQIKPEAIVWTLQNVSAEPGINMNSKDNNTDFDLEFDPALEERGFVIKKTDNGFIASKTGDISPEDESVLINSKDFGAYGQLYCKIQVNGIWVDSKQKELGKLYLPVPWDENENFIADQWEKDVGIYNRNYNATWDFDPFPAGQRSNGDGYTLYEEYRGFTELGHLFKDGKNEQVKDGHVRTDPFHKDVFVYDQDQMFKKHYAKYNPADLNWHYIDFDLMKQTNNVEDDLNRWVNYRTSGLHSMQKQYAMWIRFWPVQGNYSKSAGESPRKQSCKGDVYDPYPGSTPLKCIYMIKITQQGILNTLGKISDKSHRDRLIAEITTTTVIHEIGHGLGISHHYNNIGTDEIDKIFTSLGVLTCTMRYEADTERAHSTNFSFLKTEYCKKGQTWTRVSKDQPTDTEATDIKTEEYPSHNCYWQINVKGE